MNNITIDAATGDIVVKTLIKHIMPKLHDSSILKAVHRNLEGSLGPKMEKRLINGRLISIGSLELCYELLDKMKGPLWDAWRAESGQEFKQALCERVQQAHSSVQAQKPQPLQEHLDEQHDQIEQFEQVEQGRQAETKASVLQKAFRSINIHNSVRIDESCGEASIVDVIKMLCPGTNSNNAAFMLARVLKKDEDDKGPLDVVDAPCRSIPLAERVNYIKINGKGHENPVGDAKTIVEIIWLLPARAAKEFRRQSAETICRVLGGDLSLCDEMEQRCARLQ
ncbi:unnamed protein product, partial [Sphacelaria rigidula]